MSEVFPRIRLCLHGSMPFKCVVCRNIIEKNDVTANLDVLATAASSSVNEPPAKRFKTMPVLLSRPSFPAPSAPDFAAVLSNPNPEAVPPPPPVAPPNPNTEAIPGTYKKQYRPKYQPPAWMKEMKSLEEYEHPQVLLSRNIKSICPCGSMHKANECWLCDKKCQHGHERFKCKDCKGGSVCPHDKTRTSCSTCIDKRASWKGVRCDEHACPNRFNCKSCIMRWDDEYAQEHKMECVHNRYTNRCEGCVLSRFPRDRWKARIINEIFVKKLPYWYLIPPHVLPAFKTEPGKGVEGELPPLEEIKGLKIGASGSGAVTRVSCNGDVYNRVSTTEFKSGGRMYNCDVFAGPQTSLVWRFFIHIVKDEEICTRYYVQGIRKFDGTMEYRSLIVGGVEHHFYYGKK